MSQIDSYPLISLMAMAGVVSLDRERWGGDPLWISHNPRIVRCRPLNPPARLVSGRRCCLFAPGGASRLCTIAGAAGFPLLATAGLVSQQLQHFR
jgi:hypothetical protein